MVIKNDDYILEQLSDDSPFWDLTFPKVINKGKNNERVEFKDPLYGISLNIARVRIALWRVNRKHPTKECSPSEFNKLFLEEFTKIKDELSGIS